ncbi:MAG TPA: hypothetical protein VJ044_04715 [Candidatus Hodarchaeales archaeon]|nr:hypothetical protein [Candidatus Hodarchaeales archaeon]
MNELEHFTPLFDELTKLDMDVEESISDNRTAERLLEIRAKMEQEIVALVEKYISELQKLRKTIATE